MRLASKLFAAALLFHAIHAFSQEKHVFFDKQNVVLFSADALVRTLDAESTRANLTNTCKCFTEQNTAWASGTTAGQYAYSLGFSASMMGLSYLAHRTGHHRIEKLIPAYDIAYDGHAVIHNWTLSPTNTHKPTGFLAAR
jgi:hypothetical protein